MSMVDDAKAAVRQDPFGKVMMAVTMALIFWAGDTMRRLDVRVSEQTIQIEGLSEKVADIKATSYTSSQAHGDLALVQQRMVQFEQTMNRAAQRLHALEIQNNLPH